MLNFILLPFTLINKLAHYLSYDSNIQDELYQIILDFILLQSQKSNPKFTL